jgi:hypothetical protein
VSIPFAWDGTVSGLPAGWDAVVAQGLRDRGQGRHPTALSALAVRSPRPGSSAYPLTPMERYVTLEVGSIPGHGTTVEVRLPRRLLQLDATLAP